MAISQKLHTKLVQKLILTPSLQQAIKLLPMSTLEFRSCSTGKWGNPMLEEVPTRAPAGRSPQEKNRKKAGQERATLGHQDYEYFFGDYLDDGYRPRRRPRSRSCRRSEHALHVRLLSDHLLAALDADRRALIREIGEAIIGNSTTRAWSPRWRSCRRWVPGRRRASGR